MIVYSLIALAHAHDPFADPFRQLEEDLPTPNRIRTASGRAGPDYWQQKADYEIHVTLNEYLNQIEGTEVIHYTNNSPDALAYLWVQLDQNYLSKASGRELISSAPHMNTLYESELRRLSSRSKYDGQMNISGVTDLDNQPLSHHTVDTMMRIDLATPMSPGSTVGFQIQWDYTINNAKEIWARTGYEFFEEDGNKIYEIAQFYPRMAVYNDVYGWHHRQYLGRGEFDLEFGDFDLYITVPKDHIVGATGVLQNPEEVLTKTQRRRLEKARSARTPVFIVRPEEAQNNELLKKEKTSTWHFQAENVRDVAFASSRKFIWDALGVPIKDKVVLAQSFYPNEAEPLWSTYSTHTVAHTLKVYSDFVFPYPYPSAISVNGPIGGMEYPMICFNGPRPLEDGSYSATSAGKQPWIHSKYGLISVIIHEVGHNWFPMIINSDERSWGWMDEGLNTFVQYITESTFEDDYPSRRGEPKRMGTYMQSDSRVPIMTDSESITQYGNNAYALPAAALNLLRESVMGPELFDYAFKQYSQEWAFKHPMPADFFRIMEDASGMDLDWFWRGWFYSTSHVDISITGITQFKPAPLTPKDKSRAKEQEDSERPLTPLEERVKDGPKYIDSFPELHDFYTNLDPYEVSDDDIEAFDELMRELEPKQKELLDWEQEYIIVELENIGGLVTPVPLSIVYQNGAIEELQLPVDIWRRHPTQFRKLIPIQDDVKKVIFDSKWETGDIDRNNNEFPRPIGIENYEIEFKSDPPENRMQQSLKKDTEEE